MSVDTMPAIPRTGVWEIDPIHSSVRFAIRHHAIATFRGGLTGATGAYDGDRRRLDGEVEVANLDLQGVALLREHLLGERWFDAERHPTLSFHSETLAATGDGQLDLTGELTIKGITRPVRATGWVRGPARVIHNDGQESERLAIDLTTTIDRRHFGITHNNEITEGVLNLGWEVAIEVALELVAATED